MPPRNKLLVVAGVVIGLLILTNPSINSFKEFMGADRNYYGFTRDSNFFLFSFISDGPHKYLAIAGNFFKVESLPDTKSIVIYTLLLVTGIVVLAYLGFLKGILFTAVKKLKRTRHLERKESNNLSEFIRKAFKKDMVSYEYRGSDRQHELFTLLNTNGVKIHQNQFGRDNLISLVESSQSVFDLVSPFIGFSYIVSDSKHFFGGDGSEITEAEYGLREIIFEFNLNADYDQQLKELLTFQGRSNEDSSFPISEKDSIDELFKKAWEYKGSEEYARFFKFVSRFNHYSRYNTMLVYIQNPGITFFGTSYYWRVKFQRSVKQGARPHLILQPGGPVTLAYDIFDTNGKESPKEFLDTGLGRELFEIKGTFKVEYFEKLLAYAQKFNIKVEVKPMSYFNAGAVTTYITGKLEIYLKENHSKSQQFATLCHELAHIFLGHTRHKELVMNNKQSTRVRLPVREELTQVQEELEAETVNFLICKKLGLESQSIEYLAGYMTGPYDWKLFSYELVIKVADRLEGELS